MNNIQNIDISLQELVKNIDKNSYLIPKFQRDFVWDLKDIAELGDSIVRGYPISSLLIMPSNGTLKIGAQPLIDNVINNKSQTKDKEEKYYILDGQQRMTSISKLFLSIKLNEDDKNEFYFDLLSILLSQHPNDGIMNDSGVKKFYFDSGKKDRTQSPPSDIFCRKFPVSTTGNEQATRHHNRFISGKSITDNKFGSVISKFLSGFQGSSEEHIDKYTDYLNAVLGSVGGYSIPATIIASDSELGIVIRVFEKVNSTGKKLTLFDLINAKSFQVKEEIYKAGLSDYLTEKISENIGDSKPLKLGINESLKYDQNAKVFDRLDRIVRIFEIATLLLEEKTPSIFSSAMLGRNAEFWFEAWNKMGDTLLRAIAWMNDEGLVDIGQVTFLEYSIGVILANPKSLDNEKFKEEIKKYAFCLTLTGDSFSKSNLDIVEELFRISKQITNQHESTRYKYNSPYKNKRIELTAVKILEITKSTTQFKVISNIFYNQNVDGKFVHDIAGYQTRKIELDHHHIYPTSRVSNFSLKGKFNSIANIVLIHSNTNREEFKDKLPKEYFSKIKLNNSEKAKNWCEQNLIDINEAIKIDTEQKADIFIQNRAEKIACTVNSFFL